MVGFWGGFEGEDWFSAGVVPVSSGLSLAAGVGSGDDVGASSGVTVRPRFRGGRPCTAEALLSRAMTWVVGVGSSGGVDREDSVEEVWLSTRPWELEVGAEV